MSAWFYIESGPTNTEMVKDAFDHIFLNSVSQIVEQEGSYWIFVDMGRTCRLLGEVIHEIETSGLTINGWNVKLDIPNIV